MTRMVGSSRALGAARAVRLESTAASKGGGLYPAWAKRLDVYPIGVAYVRRTCEVRCCEGPGVDAPDVGAPAAPLLDEPLGARAELGLVVGCAAHAERPRAERDRVEAQRLSDLLRELAGVVGCPPPAVAADEQRQ